MHFKHIVILNIEGDIDVTDTPALEALVEAAVRDYENVTWDWWSLGWGDEGIDGEGAIALPVEDLTQAHLDTCRDIVVDGHWFRRMAYRPWRRLGVGNGFMFERKPNSDMPSADYIKSAVNLELDEHDIETDDPDVNYSRLAVVIDGHM